MSHEETEENEETPTKRTGVRDVAQRDLDMAGFRILNAKGGPSNGGGESSSGPIVLDDPSQQSMQNASGVIWEQPVDLSDLPGDELSVTFTAMVAAEGGKGKVELKVGGESGESDGESVATIETRSRDGELKSVRGEMEKPEDGLALFKVVGDASAQVKLRVSGKSIQIRGAGAD